jgi:D-3-phosphoglycerate dehydrogenase
MSNLDVPGVIGKAGSILAESKINIGEWRMGRHKPGGQALSFISVDSQPPKAVLEKLKAIKSVTNIKLVSL